jgi:hypothetical protein
MKVKCINTEFWENNTLTNGKEYKVIETFSNNSEFRIIDDKGNPCRYDCYHFELVSEKESMFTKKDLRSGMVVETEVENRYLLTEDADKDLILVREFGSFTISEYDDNLIHIKNSLRFIDRNWDIKKIYYPNFNSYGITATLEGKGLTLIWEREELPKPKEMTVKEVEKELGYKVKIVGDR